MERSLPDEQQKPGVLHRAMRYSALAGGKRFRPLLVYSTGKALGLRPELLDPIAVAIELIHAYSLIHDDLPAMDDDELRRGRPTCHRAFDEATAILAGDALQTFAFDRLADPSAHPDGEIRASLVATLTAASHAMVVGQAQDLAAESAAAPLGLEAIEAETGKRVGKDAGRGKATFVGHLGLDGARARATSLVETALTSLAPYGHRAEPLADAARFVVSRTH